MVPVVLIGRLALDQEFSGRGLGGALLAAALERALAVSQSVSAAVVIVHALHDRAARFYERHGFMRFADELVQLYLHLKAAAAATVRR